jgi:hypothetical protein
MPSKQDLQNYLDEAQRLVAEYGKVGAACCSSQQTIPCLAACSDNRKPWAVIWDDDHAFVTLGKLSLTAVWWYAPALLLVCCCCCCTCCNRLFCVALSVLQPIMHYGFIPAIIVAGMLFTKPRPTVGQLLFLG